MFTAATVFDGSNRNIYQTKSNLFRFLLIPYSFVCCWMNKTYRLGTLLRMFRPWIWRDFYVFRESESAGRQSKIKTFFEG